MRIYCMHYRCHVNPINWGLYRKGDGCSASFWISFCAVTQHPASTPAERKPYDKDVLPRITRPNGSPARVMRGNLASPAAALCQLVHWTYRQSKG